jgi:hypothetical protein
MQAETRVRTASPRGPAERSFAMVSAASENRGRASLHWTAGAGCPHAVLGQESPYPRIPNSNFSPAPQQVVIDAGKLDDRGIVGLGRVNALDGGIEIEQQGALSVVAHHALDPEEG